MVSVANVELTPRRGQEFRFKNLDGRVHAHIYDVSSRYQAMNDILWSGCGVMGAFHVGLEVSGAEVSYGSLQGVSVTAPKQVGNHIFRKSIPLGEMRFSPQELAKELNRMSAEWKREDYHLLNHNCLHFCQSLAEAMGVDSIPPWASRLPRIGAGVERIARADGLCWLRPTSRRVETLRGTDTEDVVENRNNRTRPRRPNPWLCCL